MLQTHSKFYPHLASLHWLPIDSRIKYKLACICYNCMSTNSPPYLSDLLTVYNAARQLRASSDKLSSVVHLSVQYPMVKGLSQDFCLGGGTRPTPPSLASVVHTFEAVAGSRGSVSAPAVSRVIDGAPERNKKKYIYM